jgi:signal transduction histidine kinase
MSALEERVLERTDELEHERARLTAIVEQMPGGLVVVEEPSGRVLKINGQAQDVLGPVAQLDGTSPLGRALDGEAMVSERVELVKPDGAACILSVSTGLVVDRAGRTNARVLLFEEITEQEARQQAEREFVTNAAHELQSPIAAITSAVEVLQAGAKEAPERDLFLEHIERESERLVKLTRALLTLSRAQTELEEPRTEVVDLRPTLEAIAERMEPAEGVVITVACPADLALVANRELLEQLLTNVARNAAKYTQSGSIRLEGELRDGAAEVRVVDTGIGIPADALPRVTERFYRADVSREGFGLGLAIVRAALDAMGGDLEVDSEGIGHGTTVTISLPLGAKLVAR